MSKLNQSHKKQKEKQREQQIEAENAERKRIEVPIQAKYPTFRHMPYKHPCFLGLHDKVQTINNEYNICSKCGQVTHIKWSSCPDWGTIGYVNPEEEILK